MRWHSPDPPSIFWQVRVPRRLGRMIRRGGFTVSFDQAFEEVVVACSEHHRSAGEWITSSFVHGYSALHHLGHAHSVEVWRGREQCSCAAGSGVEGASLRSRGA